MTNPPTTPPNVLLVLTDQWRAEALGYAGNPDVQTPRLDHFATEAVDCRLAANGCPVCTPTRASLLTALRPHRHGLFLNDAPLDPQLPSLGKHFRAAGYDTAWIGKWHVDGTGRGAPIPRERRHGFEHWRALECTHDYHKSPYYRDDETDLRIWDGYDAKAQTRDMQTWLSDREGDRPFLGVLSWGPPHSPYHTAPAADRARYNPAAVRLPPNVPEQHAADARECLAGYYAHCSALDRCFAELMDTIDELGLSDNTIVIFTSDHGDLIGAHGLWDKQGPWDESIRVPFLIRGPGLTGGRSSDLILEWLDIWPTLCGLCGLDQPADVHGRDLCAHIRDHHLPAENSCLYASYHVFGPWPRIAKAKQVAEEFQPRIARGLRDERWSYLIDDQGPWLLYDNIADPWQLHNRIDDPDLASIRESLHDRLQARLAAVGDVFPSGDDLIAAWGYDVAADGTWHIRWNGPAVE